MASTGGVPLLQRIESKEYNGVSAQRYNNSERHSTQQRSFINNETMSDVCFVISNERIYAHRIVLGMHSPVFRSMLFNGMRETMQKEVIIEEVDKDTFLLMLEYMYTGSVSLDNNLALQVALLATSDKYDIQVLKDICNQHIEKFLREDTVLDVLESAIVFNSSDLHNKCMDIIDTHATTILTSEKFLQLAEDIVEDIIKRDELTCDELDIFHALVNWGRHQVTQTTDKNLHAILSRLICRVRFPLIAANSILGIVEPKKVVPTDLLLEAYRYSSIKDASLKTTLCSPNTKPRASIPEYPVFDPGLLQATVTVSTDHKAVTKRGTTGHVVVLAKHGFMTGVHKWRVRVEGLAGNQWVSMGVAKRKTSRTVFADANHWSVSSAGQVYAGSTADASANIPNSELFNVQNGHTVEIILNMHSGQLEVKNVSVGVSVVVPVPSSGEMYPAIGLHTLGNRVSFTDFSAL